MRSSGFIFKTANGMGFYRRQGGGRESFLVRTAFILKKNFSLFFVISWDRLADGLFLLAVVLFRFWLL